MSQAEYTIEELLARYQGKYIRGSEGDVDFRSSLRTDALTLTDESLRSDTLTPDEAALTRQGVSVRAEQLLQGGGQGFYSGHGKFLTRDGVVTLVVRNFPPFCHSYSLS